MNRELTVTVMAAGEGKRMNSNIPKVLHYFHGTPMLIRILREVFILRPKKIVVITGKYHNLIKDTIDIWFLENENREKIVYVKQENPQGTGHAICCALKEYEDDQNILILNGDMPLITSTLLEKFIENDATAINAKLMVAELENPYGYGRIILDSRGKFVGIREQKDCDENEVRIRDVNVGLYYFNAMILKKYIPMITNDNKQEEYYLTDIVKIVRENTNLEIDIFKLLPTQNYMIYGVNTKDELRTLEGTYMIL
jgi:bifunctional UDP-N-acetylglucosamine pyrophosphorylase/glucosamine-1-phosphate N-acetyltransferase